MYANTMNNAIKIDPFHLYLDLEHRLGFGQTFLLEAGREDDSKDYQMSLIGVCPVVEVQIKDGIVSLFVSPGLESLIQTLQDNYEVSECVDSPWVSVVQPQSVQFRSSDPMAFLEELRVLLCAHFAPDINRAFSAGFLGYIGYDGVHYFETLPKTTKDDRDLPDVRLQWHAAIVQMIENELIFYRQDKAPIFDAVARELRERLDEVESVLEAHTQTGLDTPHLLVEAQASQTQEAVVHYDVEESAYCDSVKQAKEYIRAGDIFQVVLSTRMRIENGLHPYLAYDRLRKLNPSPYMFVAEYEGMCIFGASPEVQFRVIDGRAEMKPIAGTSRGRGKSKEEDDRLVAALKNDEKETAEHVMLVDLCRNDLGRVAVTGSVRVPDFMVVEGYSHLYHLVSRVEATLRPDVSTFHALVATFPNGTLSGAPKIRAMEIIDELETLRRGPYGGLIGMIDARGNANTAIVIRTVIQVGNTQYVQVGAGVVLDSVPEREWQECHHKAGAVLDVLRGIKQPNA